MTTHMHLDPELSTALKGPQFPNWDLEGIRARAEANRITQKVDVPEAALEVATVPSEDQAMELRIWRPIQRPPRALVYAIHGGGYTAGCAELDDLRNAELARDLGLLVLSPEYRLAPEHPFPAGATDCLAGLAWALSTLPEAALLPLVLYGDSAGAGLVESTATWHMERGGRRIEGIIMVEPDIDPTMSSRSMETQANAPMWNREKTAASWALYLAGHSHKDLPRLLPLVGREDFPRVLTFVNPVDPLRDEGIEWTMALIEAGACGEIHLMPGTYHGSLSVSGTRVWKRVQGIIEDFLAADGRSFQRVPISEKTP